jgi:predicted acylesterase/phospholipase RssA
MPWNLAAFVLSDWDRTDVLAGVFSKELFSRNGRPLTFADFRADRPRLLINSTDLQSGRRFTFSNESFDELNSDLSKFPVSYAVAASSAVPVLLHPVTLRDYSTNYAQYRHLIDGGATDNLGIQTLMDAYAGQVADAKQHNRPDPYPNGVVLIVIDAHTRFNANLSSKSDVGAIGGVKAGLDLSATLVNRVSSANVADLILRSSADSATAKDIRDEMQQLSSTGLLQITDITNHTIRVVYLSLTQVNDLKKLPFANFSESVNNIATYFNLGDAEAYQLYEAAALLVQEKFEQHLIQLVAQLDRGATTRPVR